MNRYPHDRSVLVMDNCRIHKSEALQKAVADAGCILVFLPPYSPDFNPIEESFSCGNLSLSVFMDVANYHTVKSWIRRYWRDFQASDEPEIMLLEACGTVTPAKARGWFHHAGYI